MGYSYQPNRYRRLIAKKERELTEAQSVFVKNALSVGAVEAARMAYPDATKNSQEVLAARSLRNPLIIRSLSDEAEARGLKKESCIDAVKKGLDSEDPKAYLRAAELGLKIHGELRDTRTVLPVPVDKDQYQELCREYWDSRPK